MKRLLVGIAASVAMLVYAAPALATDEEPEHKVTICHVAGLASDPANYITLTISENAVYGRNGEAGHFEENGTPRAGHEEDTFGECNPPPPPFDQCPNIPGNQPEGYDCIVDDDPPPPVDVCPNIPGNQADVPPGFALIEGECRLIQITPFCAPPAVLIDGFCVFTPPNPPGPPTLPICPPGMVATNGLDGEPGNDVCEFPPGPPPFVPPVVTTTPVTPTATSPVTTPAQPVANPKPVVKPKPKPERKPVAKAKPKPKTQVKKPKAAKPFRQPDGCPNGKAKYKGKCVTGIPGNG